MSQENVELVRQAMEALLRRDRDAWFAIHDEDYELVPIRDWPETGVRGREPAWNLNMRILDSFEWLPIEVERVDAGADKVLVHPRYEARGAAAAQRSSSITGSSPRFVRGGSFARSGSWTVTRPSKPPGCRSSAFKSRLPVEHVPGTASSAVHKIVRALMAREVG